MIASATEESPRAAGQPTSRPACLGAERYWQPGRQINLSCTAASSQ